MDLIKIFFCLIGSSAAPLFCMQQNLQPWVQQANQINIYTIDQDIEVPITNHTTVLDVKNFLKESEGIPTDWQSINPFRKKWLGLARERGQILTNNENIKQVMNEFNTKFFELFLYIPKHKQEVLKELKKGEIFP